MIDRQRNDRLCLHPDYDCRAYPRAFDDRPQTDHWQNAVYKSAWKFAKLHGFHHIADYGCGSGYKLVKYFSEFNTVGYEIPPALDHLREKYPARRWEDGNLDLIAFDADVLICADVIEHMADPIALLRKIAVSAVKYSFFSTPSLDILAGRGASLRMGPPNNETHVNEWMTAEFRQLIDNYLHVVDHLIVSIEQGTQLIIARCPAECASSDAQAETE